MKTKYDFSLFSLIKNLLLILSDALAFYTCFWLAVQTRVLLPIFIDFVQFPSFINYQYMTSEMIIFWGIIFIVFVWNSLYQKRLTFWEELLIIWKSIIVSCLLAYLFLFNFDNVLPFMSRIVLILSFLYLMIVLPLYRVILKYILFKIHFWRTPMIVGCSYDEFQKAEHIANVFAKDFYLGFFPVGFFVENENDIAHDLPIYTNKENIPLQATLCLLEKNMNPKVLSYLYSKYRKIYLIPSMETLAFKGLGGCFLFSERLLIVKIENRLNSWLAQAIKNAMDRILGLIIILLLCPVFLIIALIIKIKSPGKIFYRQARIGQNGKEFQIWKFRTMYQDADKKLEDLLNSDPQLKKEWEIYFKLDNDPRITPIGHFLRRYSLDELPQLINVLFGEMSLIGPRPFVRGEIEEIDASLLPLFAQVKPGLTGLWQVSGRNQIDRLERINIDIWYIHHWSLSLDLLILLNTPFAVFSARGAR